MPIFRRFYMLLYELESYPRPFICTHVTTASQKSYGGGTDGNLEPASSHINCKLLKNWW